MYDGMHARQEIRAAKLDMDHGGDDGLYNSNLYGQVRPSCPSCGSTRPHFNENHVADRCDFRCLNCNIIF